MASQYTSFVFSALLHLFLCGLLACSPAAALQHDVGGSAGWTLPYSANLNYQSWQASQSFAVGDTLLFKYDPNLHNVMVVRPQDYRSCSFPRPLAVFDDGLTLLQLNQTGTYFFICGVPGHCSAGQKMMVTVVAARQESVGAPSPSPSPAASPPVSPIFVSPATSPQPARAASSPAPGPSHAPSTAPSLAPSPFPLPPASAPSNPIFITPATSPTSPPAPTPAGSPSHAPSKAPSLHPSPQTAITPSPVPSPSRSPPSPAPAPVAFAPSVFNLNPTLSPAPEPFPLISGSTHAHYNLLFLLLGLSCALLFGSLPSV